MPKHPSMILRKKGHEDGALILTAGLETNLIGKNRLAGPRSAEDELSSAR